MKIHAYGKTRTAKFTTLSGFNWSDQANQKNCPIHNNERAQFLSFAVDGLRAGKRGSLSLIQMGSFNPGSKASRDELSNKI